ncbi:hypothetical protein Y017_09900 [Alcanivorax sp. 97CO-5]|jgi:hypothetical protein|uniref:DUF3108 domain-containing protein n=1 Tax=unclassified Alcanivorax TaxID=2638842 RepID=UPI0003E7F86A|nr:MULTISPECIES: DUF3108 domain-containing protein [unclassified Alcanivorax]EUC70366.1 hypothetical protein Y017_09900 [Alcanivorax sp. 97CO-5]PKG02035.1 DUF3108 domain-containing protein [Alcanivorax sp. 97CO-6]
MASPSLHRVISSLNPLILASIMLVSLTFSSVASAEQTPSPFNLDYRLKSEGIPFSIEAHRSLRQMQNGLWKMEVHAKNWLGEIRETALFNWQGCTPLSNYYGYKRRGLGKVKEAKLHIDRQTGVVASERTDKPMRSYDVSNNATDELSVSLALQCELRDGANEVELQVADERAQKTHHYTVVGRETLTIDGGRVETLKVQRQRGKNSERQTYMWFAPDHDYTLVQLMQKNDDGEHLMTLQSLEGL